MAAVNVFKSRHFDSIKTRSIDNKYQTAIFEHQNILRFYYLMAGHVKVSTHIRGQDNNTKLNCRDSFLLPAGQSMQLSQVSDDFQCIEFIVMN